MRRKGKEESVRENVARQGEGKEREEGKAKQENTINIIRKEREKQRTEGERRT